MSDIKQREAKDILKVLSKVKADFSSLKRGSPKDLKTDDFERLRRKNGLEHKKILAEDKVEEIENILVKDRTKEQHYAMIQKYGGLRNYLLSMGKFKDVPIDEEEVV